MDSEETDVILREDDIHFTIHLDPDDSKDGLLSSEIYRNSEAYQSQPRREVTSLESKGYDMTIRCRRPRYGLSKNDMGEDVPAALVVLDCSFTPLYSDSTVRFKRAEITVDFKDAPAPARGDATDRSADDAHQPEVLHWAPRNYQSPSTQLVGQASGSVGVKASDPMNIVGVGVKGSEAKPVFEESAFTIRGVKKGDPGARIRWTIREDEIKRKGLPAEIPLGVVVACVPGRRFAARVKVEAAIRLSVFQLSRVAGAKDEPLCFTYPAERVERGVDLQKETDKLENLDHLFSNKVSIRIISGAQVEGDSASDPTTITLDSS